MAWACFAVLTSGVANAADLRDFCADRPGKGTPPCILDQGHVQLEASAVDFTRDSAAGTTTQTTLVGDLLIRFGLTGKTELRVGWTPLGFIRTTGPASTPAVSQSSTSDITLGLRTSLANPDGSGLSIALQPSVSLPVGGTALGAGTWGATLLLPISYQLSPALQLALTPEIDASPNSSGIGRHLRVGSVIGLSSAVSKTLNLGAELAAFRNANPAGHATPATASLTAAWLPGGSTQVQLDAALYVRLNSDAPALQAVVGFAWRF